MNYERIFIMYVFGVESCGLCKVKFDVFMKINILVCVYWFIMLKNMWKNKFERKKILCKI